MFTSLKLQVLCGAISIASVTALSSDFSFGKLTRIARQIQTPPSGYDPGCLTQCDAAAAAENCTTTQPVECQCTETFNQAVVDCYDCLISDSNAAGLITQEDLDNFQTGIAAIEDACKDLGVPLKSLT
ncbi:hypothetical protein BXZ70DRAFT_1004746 [Cristinia sonorae]|uniref:Extracellular membrane protein CFEM domain-containing protein n=1 Tax=Cristinia sonorae TaxID=1940300 RepID=A0A8K0UW64_9AGAR|nr:hypothetical protein BXZ70DRAFT_1004746 [Cristinia sonorae]